MIRVTKRDGSAEVFMPEKVVVSAVRAGAPYETAREIAASLAQNPETTMRTEDIREYVLTGLRSREAGPAADAWEYYDEHNKKA